MPQEKLPEPGEFTRIFKRQHFGASNGPETESAPTQSVPQPPVPPPASPSPEPGEFTRYFTGGIAPQASKTQRTPSGVQRPTTPIPPGARSLDGDSTANFTQRFGLSTNASTHKAEEYGVHNPRMGPAPDLSKPAPESDPFSFRPTVPPPSSINTGEPGEYTMLFGRGDVPPPPRQAAVASTPSAPIMSDAPQSLRSVPLSTLSSHETATSRGPSEFTLISNGRQPVIAPASAEAAVNSAAATRKMPLPLNVNVAPINPLHSLSLSGSAGMSGANINTPVGSANLHAPALPPLNVAGSPASASRLNEQTKLILFFAVLAILAVILVVVVVASQKNQ